MLAGPCVCNPHYNASSSVCRVRRVPGVRSPPVVPVLCPAHLFPSEDLATLQLNTGTGQSRTLRYTATPG
ncbi:unnamed protein product [Knipowitschia caucasica]